MDKVGLIKELLDVVIERDLDYQYIKSWRELFIGSQRTGLYFEIDLTSPDSLTELQEVIDKLKGDSL